MMLIERINSQWEEYCYGYETHGYKTCLIYGNDTYAKYLEHKMNIYYSEHIWFLPSRHKFIYQKKDFYRCELHSLPQRDKRSVEILNKIEGITFKKPNKKIAKDITKVEKVTNNIEVHPVENYKG